MFKQFLAAGAMGVCQLDAARPGGVDEAWPCYCSPPKHGVPVCPHAGGVGLCELVQHLSMLDYIAVSGSLENRMSNTSTTCTSTSSTRSGCTAAAYLPPDAAGL